MWHACKSKDDHCDALHNFSHRRTGGNDAHPVKDSSRVEVSIVLLRCRRVCAREESIAAIVLTRLFMKSDSVIETPTFIALAT